MRLLVKFVYWVRGYEIRNGEGRGDFLVFFGKNLICLFRFSNGLKVN